MELVLLFSHMGLPKDILTDQGTPFTSKLMSDLCRLLQVKHLRASVYHSQMNGLIERFNHPANYAFCVICNLNRQWRKQSKATKVGGKGMHVIVVLWLNGGPAGLLILVDMRSLWYRRGPQLQCMVLLFAVSNEMSKQYYQFQRKLSWWSSIHSHSHHCYIHNISLVWKGSIMLKVLLKKLWNWSILN